MVRISDVFKNAVCVLVTNLDWFKLMVRNYPDEIRLRNYIFIAVVETRTGTAVREEVVEICKEGNVGYFIVVDESDIIQWYQKEKGWVINNFIEHYTMGMNILMQPFVFEKFPLMEKVLFLDDDVILSEGVKIVFERFKKSQLKYYRLSAGVSKYKDLSDIKRYTYNNMCDVTEVINKGFTYEKYISAHHINGGQRLLCRSDFDIDLYIRSLERFFDNKLFYQNWTYWKSTGKNKAVAFFLDEMFETMIYYSMGIKSFGLEEYTILESKAGENLDKFVKGKVLRKPIWHNITGVKKKMVYDEVIRRGELKPWGDTGEVLSE